MGEIIGKGHVVSGEGGEGVLRQADAVSQVLALMKRDDLDDTILLVSSASATAVVPLLSTVVGVVCTTGGMTSHLALVSREFGQLCVMGADLDADADLDGTRVRIGRDGMIEHA